MQFRWLSLTQPSTRQCRPRPTCMQCHTSTMRSTMCGNMASTGPQSNIWSGRCACHPAVHIRCSGCLFTSLHRGGSQHGRRLMILYGCTAPITHFWRHKRTGDCRSFSLLVLEARGAHCVTVSSGAWSVIHIISRRRPEC